MTIPPKFRAGQTPVQTSEENTQKKKKEIQGGQKKIACSSSTENQRKKQMPAFWGGQLSEDTGNQQEGGWNFERLKDLGQEHSKYISLTDA